ncbi:hypothetical protein [Aquiflexum sp.]|uniref:hypothetical protein n=1 Tax=Aquiflexum sp. TaxID=1872584 RepID=UPI003592E918
MKKFKFQISIFLLCIQVTSSCVSYISFPSSQSKAQSVDYSNPKILDKFEKEKVYRVWLNDGKMIDLILIEIKEDRLLGILKNNNNSRGIELQSLLEVPFDQIKNLEKRTVNLGGTAILALGSILFFIIGYLAIWGDTIN